jgi:hypothetical protein
MGPQHTPCETAEGAQENEADSALGVDEIGTEGSSERTG